MNIQDSKWLITMVIVSPVSKVDPPSRDAWGCLKPYVFHVFFMSRRRAVLKRNHEAIDP